MQWSLAPGLPRCRDFICPRNIVHCCPGQDSGVPWVEARRRMRRLLCVPLAPHLQTHVHSIL